MRLFRALMSGRSGSMALAQTLVVRFLTLGLNLGTGIVAARYLGPVGRAEQAAIILGASFFPFVIALGVPIAVQFKIRTDPGNAQEYTSAGVLLSLGLGALALVIGVAVLPHMLTRYSPRVILIAQIAMVIAPVTMLYTLFCAILQARRDFRTTNITRYAMPAMTLAILIGLISLHQLNPVSSSVAYLITGLFVVPWLWTKVRPPLSIRSLRTSSTELLHFGLRSYVSDILGTFAAQVDQILVIGLLSPASMGLYTVALGAARTVDLYSGSVTAVLFPQAASRDLVEIVALTGRVARITSALLGVTGTFLFILMPLLLPTFFGHSFAASVPIARIVLVSFALNAIVYVLAQAYMAAGKPGVNAIIQLLGLATTIPTMLVLIPRFGLTGAAVALVISTLIRLITTLTCFPVMLKTRVPSLFLSVDDIRYLSASLRYHSRSAAAP